MSTHREIRFVTSNPLKVAEAQAILGVHGVTVLSYDEKIEELQTTDTRRLVEDKVLKAFGLLGRPLFVEHTGLYLDHLRGLPGGLTQIFWDSLEADHFSNLFGKLAAVCTVTAKTHIAYCDSRKIHHFEGEIKGKIVDAPRGDRTFQWDCVFEPDGYSQTFAEMGTKKNDISMRRNAFDSFGKHLGSIA